MNAQKLVPLKMLMLVIVDLMTLFQECQVSIFDAGDRLGCLDDVLYSVGIWKVHGGYNLVDELPKSNAIPVFIYI